MNVSYLPSSRRAFLRHLSLGAGTLVAGRYLRGAEPPGGRKLGVALVGLGMYSSGQLAPALRRTEWCKLTGVVTGNREKGERWAQEHGFSTKNVYSYGTMDRMADNPEIDIVYVVTPPGLHAKHSIAAARAGKHVICEKPMANTVAECDAIIDACRNAKVQLSVGYRLLYEPHHLHLDELARDGDFGQLNNLSGAFGFPLRARGAWRLDKELGGGGPLMDVGIYVVQAAGRAAGGVAPLFVTAKERPKSDPELFSEVEESLDFTLEFPGGQRCEGFTSYGESAHHFRAAGERGWIELKPAFSYSGIDGRTSRGDLDFPGVNQQALHMDDFARCVIENRPCRASGELGRTHMAVIEAIYASALAGGKRVDVQNSFKVVTG